MIKIVPLNNWLDKFCKYISITLKSCLRQQIKKLTMQQKTTKSTKAKSEENKQSNLIIFNPNIRIAAAPANKMQMAEVLANAFS